MDFPSAFDTVQPHLLAEKLLSEFKLDFDTNGWILDFRENTVCKDQRINWVLSDMLIH